MERRTESTNNCTDRGNASEEFDKSHDQPRSRKENGTPSTEDREKSENRGRRRIARSGERAESKKSISRDERKAGEKNTKEVNGISDSSKTIITRRVSRRQAAIQPTHKNKRNRKRGNVPAIPNRVFKALHILRHEKFLRVISRYLKPEN